MKTAREFDFPVRLICNAREKAYLEPYAAEHWPDVEIRFIVRGKPLDTAG